MKRFIIIASLLAFISLGSAQEAAETAPIVKKNSWGIGFGIPYGVLGVNTDINVATNLSISIGLGTTIVSGIGYNFGLKYFLAPLENGFRPRILATYGINAISAIGDDTDSYTGFSIGGGFQWMWGTNKSSGMDFDIIYIATTGYDIDELRAQNPRYQIEDFGKVKISLGYRHSF